MKPKRFSKEERERLISRINDLGPWFHNIEVAEEVFTKPGSDYTFSRWRIIEPLLPSSLEGKTCLDAGCNAGFFSLKMSNKGAQRVVGIDNGQAKQAIAQAKFVRDTLEVQNVEYYELSAYDVEKLNTLFDHVLFLGVLYHLRHPLLALEKLRKVTRGNMILQTIAVSTPDPGVRVPEDISLRSDILKEPGFPRLHFIERALHGDRSCWWVPNAECVMAMLRSAGFRVEKHIQESNGYEIYVLCS